MQQPRNRRSPKPRSTQSFFIVFRDELHGQWVPWDNKRLRTLPQCMKHSLRLRGSKFNTSGFQFGISDANAKVTQ